MLNTEQFAAAGKAQLDTVFGLTAKAFDRFEQLAALNMQAAKSGLEAVAETSLAALSAKDPQALAALQSSLKPQPEVVAAYGRQVAEIIAAARAEVEQLAAEQFATAQKQFADAMEAAAKNAPEGTTNGFAALKQTIATATNAFESLQKAGRQAADAAQAQFEAATATATTKTARAKRA
jgi:phasin family protein